MKKSGNFFETALASALDLGLLGEDELLTEVGLAALVESLSPDQRAATLGAALEADIVSAELVVRTIGIAELCSGVSPQRLWRAVALAGSRAAGGASLPRLSEKTSVPARPVKPDERTAQARDSSTANDSGSAPSADSSAAGSESTSDSRKPNRRASGAGATSRRRVRESTPPEAAAMFMASGRSNARAATEPSFGPDLDDIVEIEVLDNTAVNNIDPK